MIKLRCFYKIEKICYVCTKHYGDTIEAAPKRKVPYWLKPDKMKQTKDETNVEEDRPKKVGVKMLFLKFSRSAN